MTDDMKSVCTRCQIGIMQHKLMPFTMIENGHMVNVQRMPALTAPFARGQHARETAIRLRPTRRFRRRSSADVRLVPGRVRPESAALEFSR